MRVRCVRSRRLAVMLVHEAHPAEAGAVDGPARSPVLAGVSDCGAAPGGVRADRRLDTSRMPTRNSAPNRRPRRHHVYVLCAWPPRAATALRRWHLLRRAHLHRSRRKRRSQVWFVARDSPSRWPRSHPLWSWPELSSVQRTKEVDRWLLGPGPLKHVTRMPMAKPRDRGRRRCRARLGQGRRHRESVHLNTAWR